MSEISTDRYYETLEAVKNSTLTLDDYIALRKQGVSPHSELMLIAAVDEVARVAIVADAELYALQHVPEVQEAELYIDSNLLHQMDSAFKLFSVKENRKIADAMVVSDMTFDEFSAIRKNGVNVCSELMCIAMIDKAARAEIIEDAEKYAQNHPHEVARIGWHISGYDKVAQALEKHTQRFYEQEEETLRQAVKNSTLTDKEYIALKRIGVQDEGVLFAALIDETARAAMFDDLPAYIDSHRKELNFYNEYNDKLADTVRPVYRKFELTETRLVIEAIRQTTLQPEEYTAIRRQGVQPDSELMLLAMLDKDARAEIVKDADAYNREHLTIWFNSDEECRTNLGESGYKRYRNECFHADKYWAKELLQQGFLFDKNGNFRASVKATCLRKCDDLNAAANLLKEPFIMDLTINMNTR